MGNFDGIVITRYSEYLLEEQKRKNAPLEIMSIEVKSWLRRLLNSEEIDVKVDYRRGAVVVDDLQFTVFTDDHSEEHLYGLQTCPKCGKDIANHNIDSIQSLYDFTMASRTKCSKCSTSLLTWFVSLWSK